MKLELDNIMFRAGETTFHYNICLENGIIGIYGPSGAGKTTLMNLICDIQKPNTGQMLFNGKKLFDHTNKTNIPASKRNIGVVFQENNLFPHLNVKQNLLYSNRYQKNKKQAIEYPTVIELLELSDLSSKKPAFLSGGERQRVAIGRALLSQPELLLLDEPFSSLDKIRRKQIISYLLKINDLLGIPILIISHDLEDILKLTRNLTIIESGKVLDSGHYLDIADTGRASEIISHKRFINILDVYHQQYNPASGINTFTLNRDAADGMLATNSNDFINEDRQGKKVRISIYPDDIAISTTNIPLSSIQNQLEGKIKEIRCDRDTYYLYIDCGTLLVAEITRAAYEKLYIRTGMRIFCLIKAKAIDIIHVYEH
ncbi:MAG: molybdenum ABC transporter ATP-binding protein [Bacteroidetes bacterium]|jgi:molybdate transport system ATP-binding protein|nr:molybdenum ABC transporter ATP-binding protein [Bacteroidota bacterium]